MTPTLPGRRQFLTSLAPYLSADELKQVKFAYVLAKVAHQGQERDQGGRYFDHPKAVALILTDELGITDAEMIVAALLHDTVEDTDLRQEDLFAELFGDWVVQSLGWLTKRPGYDYHAGLLEADWRTLMVKLADRTHNLRTMGGVTPEKRARKVKETYDEYVPLCDKLVRDTPPEYQQQAETLKGLLMSALTDLN